LRVRRNRRTTRLIGRRGNSATWAMRLGSRYPSLRSPLVAWRARGLSDTDVIFASYPRSGSTWLRFLLFEVLTSRSAEFEIVDDVLPELGAHRDAPRVFSNGGRLVHTHEKVSPPRSCRCIYMIRDPRSVVLSEYRFHRRRGIDTGSLPEFVARFLAGRASPHGSWSDHVEHWTAQRNLVGAPPTLLRYEDLRSEPDRELTRVIRDMGLEPDPDLIASAIHQNTVEAMQGKEDRASDRFFGRRVDRQNRFVRTGSVQGWRSELPPGLAAAVSARMSHAMLVGRYS
jgi:Sulfotransferase domain